VGPVLSSQSARTTRNICKLHSEFIQCKDSALVRVRTVPTLLPHRPHTTPPADAYYAAACFYSQGKNIRTINTFTRCFVLRRTRTVSHVGTRYWGTACRALSLVPGACKWRYVVTIELRNVYREAVTVTRITLMGQVAERRYEKCLQYFAGETSTGPIAW
jgi:hypothetical protein